jgi:hypothetical protein
VGWHANVLAASTRRRSQLLRSTGIGSSAMIPNLFGYVHFQWTTHKADLELQVDPHVCELWLCAIKGEPVLSALQHDTPEFSLFVDCGSVGVGYGRCVTQRRLPRKNTVHFAKVHLRSLLTLRHTHTSRLRWDLDMSWMLGEDNQFSLHMILFCLWSRSRELNINLIWYLSYYNHGLGIKFKESSQI